MLGGNDDPAFLGMQGVDHFVGRRKERRLDLGCPRSRFRSSTCNLGHSDQAQAFGQMVIVAGILERNMRDELRNGDLRMIY